MKPANGLAALEEARDNLERLKSQAASLQDTSLDSASFHSTSVLQRCYQDALYTLTKHERKMELAHVNEVVPLKQGQKLPSLAQRSDPLLPNEAYHRLKRPLLRFRKAQQNVVHHLSSEEDSRINRQGRKQDRSKSKARQDSFIGHPPSLNLAFDGRAIGRKERAVSSTRARMLLSKRQNFSDRTIFPPVEDDTLKLLVANRRMKLHSLHTRPLRVDFSLETDSFSKLVEPIEHRIKAYSVVSESELTAAGANMRGFTRHEARSQSIVDDSASEEKAFPGVSSAIVLHLHEGKCDTTTEEWASFQRIYGSIMRQFKLNLARLEHILQNKRVGEASLDARQLAFLSVRRKCSDSELVRCLIKSSLAPHLILPKAKFQGSSGKIAAVSLITATWKMLKERRRYQRLKKAVHKLQRFFLKKGNRIRFQKEVNERHRHIMEGFEKKQAELGEKWKDIRHSKRIEVHVASIEASEARRLGMCNFDERHNVHLSRMFRLRDPNLVIIYVTRKELPEELANYYFRILELSGVPAWRDRLIFLSPQPHVLLPSHLSLTRQLYYCSRTLRQIRLVTEAMPTLLFPAQFSNDLVSVCHELGCYLYGGEPQIMRSLHSRSQFRRFLTNVGFEVLPAAMEMYDYGELLNTLAVLLIKHWEVKRWIFKIDDETSSKGLAVLDLTKARRLHALLRKVTGQREAALNISESQEGAGYFPTQLDEVQVEVAEEADAQNVTVKIRDYLRSFLPQKLSIACRSLYQTYSEFMGQFVRQGGVIEAQPEGELRFPSACLNLEPNGQWNFLSTYEKLCAASSQSIGCYSPQHSINHQVLAQQCDRLCRSLSQRKVFGVLSVDFIAVVGSKTKIVGNYKEETQGPAPKIQGRLSTKSWIIGIDPYLNHYGSSFHLFDTLVGGHFTPEQQSYTVVVPTNNPSKQLLSLGQQGEQTNTLTGRRTKYSLRQKDNPRRDLPQEVEKRKFDLIEGVEKAEYPLDGADHAQGIFRLNPKISSMRGMKGNARGVQRLNRSNYGEVLGYERQQITGQMFSQTNMNYPPQPQGHNIRVQKRIFEGRISNTPSLNMGEQAQQLSLIQVSEPKKVENGGTINQEDTLRNAAIPSKSQILDQNGTSTERALSQCLRSYIYLPIFWFGVNKTLKQFFKQARLKGLTFDMEKKQGVCMSLLETFSGGLMGVMVIGHDFRGCLEHSKKVLKFVEEVMGRVRVKYGRVDAHTDALYVSEVISALTRIEKKERVSNKKSTSRT